MSESAGTRVTTVVPPVLVAPRGGVEGRTSLLTPSFILLMLVQASFGYAFSSYLLLAKFLVVKLNAGPATVGLVTMAYGVAAIVFIPLVGAAVDRRGRRGMLTAGALVMAGASLGFVLVDSVGAFLYTLRAVQGLGFAMAFVAGVTLAVDEAPPERLGQVIGLIGLAMLSMNAVAPVAVEALAEHAGWDAAFVAAAGAALLCAGLSRLLHDSHGDRGERGPVPGLRSVVTDPRQCRIAVIVALTGTAFGAMMVFHQPFALELGADHVRNFFVGYTGAALLVRLPLGGFLDRAGRREVALVSLVLYAAVAVGMRWLEPATLIVFGSGLGVAHGLFYPALNAIAVEGKGVGERGKVMALFQAAFSVGLALGPLPLGLLAERVGFPAMFLAAGGCALAALVLLALSPDGRRDVARVSVMVSDAR